MGKRTNPYWLLDSCNKRPESTSCTPRNLREFVDYDYVKTLSAEEKAWLCAFTDAYYTGKKNEVSQSWTKEQMQDSYGRNNRRWRSLHNLGSRMSPAALAVLPTREATPEEALIDEEFDEILNTQGRKAAKKEYNNDCI